MITKHNFSKSQLYADIFVISIKLNFCSFVVHNWNSKITKDFHETTSAFNSQKISNGSIFKKKEIEFAIK